MYETKQIGNHTIIFADSEGIYKHNEELLKQGAPDTRLFYWCNSLGEINVPGSPDLMHCGAEEDLSPAAARLYEKYQMDTDGMRTYTVRFNGEDGILFTALVDDDWVEDVLKTRTSNLFPILRAAAETLPEQDELFQHCDILALDQTAPMGSELAFFFPESEEDALRAFAKQTNGLSDLVYQRIFVKNKELRDDICPLCGEEVEFDGAYDHDDDGATLNWICPHCGATGKAGYSFAFTQHYCVQDGNGKPVEC